MKQRYRFVGRGVSNVGDQQFNSFGQCAEFTDAYAREVYLGGAAFITQEQFDSLEFEQQDLLQYFNEFYCGEVPAELEEKVRLAQAIYRDSRAELLETN